MLERVEIGFQNLEEWWIFRVSWLVKLVAGIHTNKDSEDMWQFLSHQEEIQKQIARSKTRANMTKIEIRTTNTAQSYKKGRVYIRDRSVQKCESTAENKGKDYK